MAAAACDVQVIDALIEHGADINEQDRYGSSALHCSIAPGRKDNARRLLEMGANPELRDRDYGWSPLHQAAAYSNVDILE